MSKVDNYEDQCYWWYEAQQEAEDKFNWEEYAALMEEREEQEYEDFYRAVAQGEYPDVLKEQQDYYKDKTKEELKEEQE